MTIFMVTHDIAEAFRLGTRLIVFDKVRPDAADGTPWGATITYDLPLRRKAPAGDLAAAAVRAAETLEQSVSIISPEKPGEGPAEGKP
jgi:NitT/TauT family transport system ATP-binding protein